MEKVLLNVHLFNCDRTYKLDAVENLLRDVEPNTKYNFSVEKHYFPLPKMADTCAELEKYQMDFAVFAVHANESTLSLNEEGAGIGYARIYRALLHATGNRVLIVIGGDDNYKGEENTQVLSRWAKRKMVFQFSPQYLDGRKSFIFSWEKKHHLIHEDAILHFLDPGMEGQKFVPVMRPDSELQQADTKGKFTESEQPAEPSRITDGKLLRATVRLEHGEITEKLQKYPDDWELPPELVSALRKLYSDRTAVMKLEIWEDKDGNHNLAEEGTGKYPVRLAKTKLKNQLQHAATAISDDYGETDHSNSQEDPTRRYDGKFLRATVRLQHGEIIDTPQVYPENWKPPQELLRSLRKLYLNEPSIKQVKIWEDRDGNHSIRTVSV